MVGFVGSPLEASCHHHRDGGFLHHHGRAPPIRVLARWVFGFSIWVCEFFWLSFGWLWSGLVGFVV